MWSRLIWAAVMIKAIVTWGKARCLGLSATLQKYGELFRARTPTPTLARPCGDKSSKRTSKSKKAFLRIICNCGHVSLFANRLPRL